MTKDVESINNGTMKLEDTNLLRDMFDPFNLSTKMEYRHTNKNNYRAYSYISTGLINKSDLGANIHEVALSYNPNKSVKSGNSRNDINLEIKACDYPNYECVTFYEAIDHKVPKLEYILNIHIVKKNSSSINSTIIQIKKLLYIQINAINSDSHKQDPTLEQFKDRVKLISTDLKKYLKDMFVDDINFFFEEMRWNYDLHVPLSEIIFSPHELISTLTKIYSRLNGFITEKLKMHKDKLYKYMKDFQYKDYYNIFVKADKKFKTIEESSMDYSQCENNKKRTIFP
jgi:hypothetical protein